LIEGELVATVPGHYSHHVGRKPLVKLQARFVLSATDTRRAVRSVQREIRDYSG